MIRKVLGDFLGKSTHMFLSSVFDMKYFNIEIINKQYKRLLPYTSSLLNQNQFVMSPVIGVILAGHG